MVDQSRIGRTTRSNPASYVGAFDAIRDLFARQPEARERKYSAGTFSFNAGNGRCPACGGNGFEHVEMQFLSDVYLRCPDCNGRRYRAEVLEVTLCRGGMPGKSIADVLDLTVSEALAFFCADREVCLRLAPLAEVGLDYLRLGQPVPTLSGGEAQRLKLAGHLADSAAHAQQPKKGATAARQGGPRRGSLFLFDEPTTGLHFDDVAKLLRAFRRLIDAGHSLLVIEHNLDVIRAADWIIDLGPEGGEAGGCIVGIGTPDEIVKLAASHTGRALLEGEHRRCGGARRGAIGLCKRAGATHRVLGHRDSRRPGTQSQEHRREPGPQQIHGHYRRLGQRQEHAGIRHFVRRGSTPLSRILERLCAAVRAALCAPRRGRHFRHPAHGCDRATHQPRRTQEHGGDAHRDLSLSAFVVREIGSAILPRLQRPDRAAIRRCHCRPPAQRISRATDRLAGSIGHRAQGSV